MIKKRELTEQELRTIQLIELEMLCELDRICKKCGIKYNIIAGTLLGAVRHGGFIPWDDDADVAMMREEYEKFRLACDSELDKSRFYFQDHRNTPGYRWGYGKLRRKETLFLRQNQEHMPYEQGIFIDIFPLDYVPENKLCRTLHYFHSFCIRKIMWAPVGKLIERNLFKRIGYNLLNTIPERVLFHHYEQFIHQSNRKESGLVRTLTFPAATKDYGYKRAWYEESVELKFEGKNLCAPQMWDEYLTFKFKNYMELPAEQNRKTHPITKLKLIEGDCKLGDQL